jgi:hypothetical protein
MGNKFCHCHNLCPDNKTESNLTFKNNKNFYDNFIINNNSFENISQFFNIHTIQDENCSNKKIYEIYKKNCLLKIIKNFRIYKNNKQKKVKIKNDKEINNIIYLKRKLIQDDGLMNKENNNILDDFTIKSEESNILKTISECSKESNKLSYFPQKILNPRTVYKNIPQIKIKNSRNNFNNNIKNEELVNKTSSSVTKKEFSLTEENRKNSSISNNNNKYKLLRFKFDKLNSTNKTTFENSKEIENKQLINSFKK